MNDEEIYCCPCCGHEDHPDKFGKHCPHCGADLDEYEDAAAAARAALRAPAHRPQSGGDGLGEGGRYWRERAEFWRAQAVALGWREKRDAENGEAAPPSVPVGVEGGLRKLCSWKHLMSYNESYFGEPEGELKSTVYVIERALAQQPPSVPVGVEGFDAWFDEYTKNNYTDEMLAEAAWKAARANVLHHTAAQAAEIEVLRAVRDSFQRVGIRERERAERLAEALRDRRDWFEAQAKSISKGNGSSWDLMQVREQRDLCDRALLRDQEAGE